MVEVAVKAFLTGGISVESYSEFRSRCERQGVKATFTDPSVGAFYILSEAEAAVTAQLGVSEEAFLEAAGGLAKYQDSRRHRRQEEEGDSPELRRIESEYAAELGVTPEQLSAERVRQGREA